MADLLVPSVAHITAHAQQRLCAEEPLAMRLASHHPACEKAAWHSTACLATLLGQDRRRLVPTANGRDSVGLGSRSCRHHLIAVESSAPRLLLTTECVLLVLVAERTSESVGLSGRLGVFSAVPIGVRATADTADDPKDDRAP